MTGLGDEALLELRRDCCREGAARQVHDDGQAHAGAGSPCCCVGRDGPCCVGQDNG